MSRFTLPDSLAAWNTPGFGAGFKREVELLDPALLPLQQGLRSTSSVADAPITVLLLVATESSDRLRVKAGICYSGITGGCSCADDPTPLEAQAEYCELVFEIDRRTGAASVTLAPED